MDKGVLSIILALLVILICLFGLRPSESEVTVPLPPGTAEAEVSPSSRTPVLFPSDSTLKIQKEVTP